MLEKIIQAILSFGLAVFTVDPTPPTPTPTPSPTATRAPVVVVGETASAKTPRVWGYDVIGLAQYCNRYLKAPKLPAVSTLMRTFGDPLPCLKRRIELGGITDIQLDLRDATCWRNGVCPSGTPSLTNWNDLKAIATRVNKFKQAYPDITFWLSPYLEHDITDRATVQKAMDTLKAACPSCKLINSPFRGATVPPIPLEKHGTKVNAFSVSGDGASIFDGDNIENDGNKFQHRLSGSDQTYAWWNELNRRCTGENGFTPIAKRTVRPELWQFRMAHKILTTKEDPFPPTPSTCKTIVSIDGKAGEIHKPLAERYCNGQTEDIRGNRPLLITKKRGNPGQVLRIWASNGKQIGSYRYYGTYTQAGLYRWYVGSGSRDNAWQLYQKSGSEWAFVEYGNGRCLRYNVIRRQGVYR